jgi:hypothetical protein
MGMVGGLRTEGVHVRSRWVGFGLLVGIWFYSCPTQGLMGRVWILTMVQNVHIHNLYR